MIMDGHGVPEDSYAPNADQVQIKEREAEVKRLNDTVKMVHDMYITSQTDEEFGRRYRIWLNGE